MTARDCRHLLGYIAYLFAGALLVELVADAPRLDNYSGLITCFVIWGAWELGRRQEVQP